MSAAIETLRVPLLQWRDQTAKSSAAGVGASDTNVQLFRPRFHLVEVASFSISFGTQGHRNRTKELWDSVWEEAVSYESSFDRPIALADYLRILGRKSRKRLQKTLYLSLSH